MPLKPGVLDLMWEIYGKETFENTIREFYKDQLGRRTIGVGVLLDCDNPGQSYTSVGGRARNLATVLKMRFVKVDPNTKQPTNVPATKEEITQDWNDAEKIRQKVANGRKQPTRLSALRRPKVMLAEPELRVLFDKMNREHLAILSKFSWYQVFLDEWPADAQLGILAIAYAGPGMLSLGQTFGKVPQWCKVERFDEAAKACLHALWSGSEHRKRFFAKCFEAAHQVRTNKKDESTLYVRTLMAL